MTRFERNAPVKFFFFFLFSNDLSYEGANYLRGVSIDQKRPAVSLLIVACKCSHYIQKELAELVLLLLQDSVCSMSLALNAPPCLYL